jgi:O-antigen/teichoic acid export membrane protein
MGTIKKLLSDSVVYGLAGAISRSINIFLVPVYTKIFTPADYGIINLVNNFYTLVFILTSLSLDTAVYRWYFEKEDSQYRHKVVGSWVYSTIISSLTGCTLIFLLSEPLSNLILKQDQYAIFFQYIALALGASIFNSYMNTLLRIEQKAILLAIFNTVSGLLTVGLTIVFVIYLNMRLEGVFLGIAVSQSTTALVAFILLRKWFFPVQFDKTLLKNMLKYSLPAIPAGIAYWVLNNSSGYFIDGLYKQRSEVGLFNIANSIAALVGLVVGAFQQAWVPFAMSIHKNPDAVKVYARVLVLYCAIVGGLAMLTGMFSYEILVLFTHKDYYDAKNVAVILVFSQTIIGLTAVGMIGSAIQKSILPFGKIVFIGACLFVVLCFILIPVFGKEGAAWSSVIAQSIMPVYVFYRSQKDYYVPYNFKMAVFLFSLSVIMVVLGITIPYYLSDILIYQVFVKIIIFAFFVAVLFLIKVFNVQELRTKIRQFVQKT